VGYRYDLASRLTAASDASPAITAIAVPVPNNPFSTTYSYDALNRPSSVNWTPAPTAVTPTLGTNVSFTHTYNRTNQRIGQSTKLYSLRCRSQTTTLVRRIWRNIVGPIRFTALGVAMSRSMVSLHSIGSVKPAIRTAIGSWSWSEPSSRPQKSRSRCGSARSI
jgi:hypothetical protein